MNALRALLARRRQRRFGEGSGFDRIRPYVAGDDVRRIDWAAGARTGIMQTRVMHDEPGLTLGAVCDTSASMRVGRRRPLMAVAMEAVQTYYEAALPDDRCVRIAVDPTEDAFVLATALKRAERILPRGGALLVVSDFHDPLDGEILRRLGWRFDCTALAARDPWFDAFTLDGSAFVRDAESGRAARIVIGVRERQAYHDAVRKREELLLRKFRAANWQAGVLVEDDGPHSLLRAFGLA